jgi:anthranilate synthase component 1
MGFDPKTILKGYSDKVEIIKNNKIETIQTNNPFEELKKLLGKSENQSYRYLGGAVGVVNYDAIRLVENIPDTHDSPQPLMEFGIYDDGILYDNIHKKLFYFYHDQNRFEQFKISDDSFEEFRATEVKPNMDQGKFSNIVNKAKQYIHEGDIFQVVLSRKFAFDTQGDNLTLYKTLRKLNPSPYMYHLKQDNKTIIGASPEMLIRITNDKVETFPIAGTRKITDDEDKNNQLAKELLRDEKELAEHTMLVDLGRNDIGRVCKYGTVHTEELMKIKRFSHVQHIVTHVVGNLAPKNDMFDAFKAVFPAGTVSGAPKVRAMEIIDELETEARGPYAGAVGYFSFNGCCDFAIAIRSIFINGNKGFVQSGAGIVSDSIAENEFKETEHKARAMLQALREATK